MSKIREALVAATGLKIGRGEDEQTFLSRVAKAVSEDIDDATWNGLGDPAQDWNNLACKALTAGQPLPPFPDAVAAEPALAPRGRTRGAAAAPAALVAYEPKEGDEVIATSKRNKVVTGFIVEIKDGIAYVNPDREGPQDADIECPLVAYTFALADAGDTAPAEAAAQEPAGPVDPQVGDTVEAVTKRDNVIVGNVVELGDDLMVLKDAAGGEHELVPSILKSVVVKVSNSASATAPAVSAGRTRGAAATTTPPAAGGDKPKRSSNPEGVSLGGRIREIVCENEALTSEQVSVQLTKEGIQFRDTSVKMIWKDTHNVIKLLRDLKKLK